MDPNVSPENGSPPSEGLRSGWRSLSHLRDRIDAAVREIERLRAENADLARRLVDLEDGPPSPSFSFGDDESPDVLRARVQGFIDLVDGMIESGSPPSTTEPS